MGGGTRRQHDVALARRRGRGAWVLGVAAVGVGLLVPSAHGASARAAVRGPRRRREQPGYVEALLDGDAGSAAYAAAAREWRLASTHAPLIPTWSTSAAVTGQWSTAVTPANAVTAVHMVLMRTGKVLIWTDHSVKPPGSTYYEMQAIASVYDPVTHTARRVDPPLDYNIFCGYATTLADGRVLVVGGLDPDNGYSGQGLPIVLTFDPATEQWTIAPPMHQGRWYPSLVRLTDGRTVVVGGHAGGARNIPNHDVEVIAPTVGTPQLVAQYNIGAGEDMYPSEFQLPDGRIFSIASKFTHFIDPTTWTITKGPSLLANAYTYPNATILPLTPGGHFVIQMTGGRSGGPQTNWPATTTSVRIDMSATSPAFKAMAPLPQPRTNTNTVLLPDGTLLMVGGNETSNFTLPTYQALQYSPASDTWTPLAAQAKRRAYHSTAVLLPDGTVLSGGDTGGGGGGAALEVFSPPYLFRGPRPVITSAPAVATRGSTINVTTNVAVKTVELIAPGAATHATDLSQRLVQLATASVSATTLAATLPADNTLPPGPYMLFAVDANGVPSVATWVTVS